MKKSKQQYTVSLNEHDLIHLVTALLVFLRDEIQPESDICKKCRKEVFKLMKIFQETVNSSQD
jgi:hypothetical protein